MGSRPRLAVPWRCQLRHHLFPDSISSRVKWVNRFYNWSWLFFPYIHLLIELTLFCLSSTFQILCLFKDTQNPVRRETGPLFAASITGYTSSFHPINAWGSQDPFWSPFFLLLKSYSLSHFLLNVSDSNTFLHLLSYVSVLRLSLLVFLRHLKSVSHLSLSFYPNPFFFCQCPTRWVGSSTHAVF